MHKHPSQPGRTKPFLKWIGGKSRLLPKLLPLIPSGTRLIEPFVGAGSVFLASDFPEYVISDANPDLAAVWVALKSRPGEFMARASEFFAAHHHSQEAYVQVRAEFNTEVDRFERAVRLPYLNKFGFNGIYRVNRSGQCNVPYGRPKTLPNFPWQEMEAAAERLSRCTVLAGGFEAAIDLAGRGDVVYCDPPYLASAEGRSFTGYTGQGFGIAEHEALVVAGLRAVERGATVLISNHDTLQTRGLYAGWDLDTLEAFRSVSAAGGARGVAKELVARLPKWFDRSL
jgi:DNA adenine methylase